MLMSRNLTGHLDRVAGGQIFLQICRDLPDLSGDAAEIAPLGTGVDLVDRLDVGLVRAARHRVAREGRHIAELARHRLGRRRGGSRADRCIAEVVERANLVFRRLDCDGIGGEFKQTTEKLHRNLRSWAAPVADSTQRSVRKLALQYFGSGPYSGHPFRTE